MDDNGRMNEFTDSYKCPDSCDTHLYIIVNIFIFEVSKYEVLFILYE